MTTSGPFLVGAVITALFTSIQAPPKQAAPDSFTLTRDVPNDVFLCVAARHNPRHEFLDRYWGEVFEALQRSGVGTDALELLGSLFSGEQKTQFEHFKERAAQLLAGVNWEELASREMVFAERMPPPVRFEGGGIVGMPHMVWLLRGSAPGAAQNFEGLAAILESLVTEINGAAGRDVLAAERSTRHGAQVAALRLPSAQAGSELVLLAVALRDDVVLIAVGEPMLNDVLSLMDGSSDRASLADEARFKAAFAKLPPAQDSLTFFDMQAMLRSLRNTMNMVAGAVGSPRDVYVNTDGSAAANTLNSRAYMAYQGGDIKKALALTQEAYAADAKNAIVLYNLACFNALLGNHAEALDWLEKAVAGGFYAPDKISSDPDLKSLRDEPRYQAAVTKAADLAVAYGAEDTVVNSTQTGEVYQLTVQALQAYEKKDYEQGLKLSEQAYAVDPHDSRVLYSLACFHALLGHTDKALDFLQQAVAGGFYCPRHISKDPDLASLRTDERYQAALAQARKLAGENSTGKRGAESEMWSKTMNRLADAVGILDYVASVESTDGYAVRSESVSALVPNARENPFYPVFGAQKPLTGFDRYLPQETESYAVSCGLDWAALYKFLEDTVRLTGPPGEELLAKWGEFQAQLGVDVRKDVLDWIGGEFVKVTLEQGRGSVWLLKVTNEPLAREKVGAAIQFFSTKLNEVIAKQPALAPLAMLAVRTSPLDDKRLEGFENLYLALSPEPAVWGFADGCLVFGSSADAVALCLATAHGEHPNVRSNPRVVAEALLPDGPVVSVTLTDQRKLGEEIAKGIGIASMVVGMIGAFVPDAEARPVITKIAGILAKLTPVVRKIDFYKSAASNTSFDGQMWHARGVTHYFSPEERAGKAATQPHGTPAQ